MEDFQHVGYSKEVIEFVTVAKEFCDLVERSDREEKKPFLLQLQKLLPLIYLKGCLLPGCESNELEMTEEVVTENDYDFLRERVWQLMAEDDDYLEVFDDNMQFNEMPVVASIAEKVCDIYQDLKNFISLYQHGMPDVIQEALWLLNTNFEFYWGKTCTSLLRAVHAAIYRVTDEEI
ncbi:MAG: DUF5063 domain-containing protein [Odoribacteraceae bacterium]|jgi:hypothetical protein|nr:DUF5063 domain-containing protein [Odoribacteraceae bacterium]